MSKRTKTPAPEHGGRILVVDDDPIVARSLASFLEREGYGASWCLGGREALDLLEQSERTDADPTGTVEPFNLVLSDVSMPGMSGLELLRRIGERFPSVVVLMLTAYGTIENAVEAIRQGASDYLSKPIVDSELRLSLQKALRQQSLLHENATLRRRLDEKFGMDTIVGSDYRMVKASELIEAVAPSKATVLMTGESGTGKSLIAKVIHERSPRRDGPFVEIHCGSIP